jgi:hypothetical protein
MPLSVFAAPARSADYLCKQKHAEVNICKQKSEETGTPGNWA